MQVDYFNKYALYMMQVGAMENLGELIRLLRKERKMSQQDLAKQYGMSRSTISGIENNTISEIGLRKVEAILNGFGYELRAVPRRSTRPTLDTLKKVNFHG